MTISSLPPALAVAPKTTAPAVPTRAADGDYKVKNANSVATKDADGDYRPRSAAASASHGVQAALINLRLGG